MSYVPKRIANVHCELGLHVNAKVDIFCKIEQNPKEYYNKSSLTFYQTLREFMDRVI